MNMDYYKRIAAYLSQYACTKGGRRIPPQEVYIRSAIITLMDDTGMTAEQIRREALEQYNVIIADEFFEEDEEI